VGAGLGVELGVLVGLAVGSLVGVRVGANVGARVGKHAAILILQYATAATQSSSALLMHVAAESRIKPLLSTSVGVEDIS
jgi:hypothetical protein